jgi:hypothetical protein
MWPTIRFLAADGRVSLAHHDGNPVERQTIAAEKLLGSEPTATTT